MAKEILDAIYNAEEDCKTRENEAILKAHSQIDNAKTQADELIKNAELKALNNANALIDKAKAEADCELEKAKKDANDKCLEISKIADNNRDTVIKLAVESLLK